MMDGKTCEMCRTQHNFNKESETKARGDALECVVRRVLEHRAGDAACAPRSEPSITKATAAL